MIVHKYAELVFRADTSFTQKQFEKERNIFIKKLKKNVDSYFYLTHENFELKVFKMFEKEFVNYIDFFLKNKDNLTRIKLIKRNHGIFLRNTIDDEPSLMRNQELEDELQDNLKDLEYIDSPQNLWNDLDTRIKNMFVERYIGKV